MTTPKMMDKDPSQMTERLLNFTLEIIYLLTGEHFPPVKSGDQVTITVPSAHSLIPEKYSNKKILEVTKKMMELLTGEVPIRCQDVTVYFSMEEWEYLEGHKDLYKDVMMDNQPPLTSPVGGHEVWNTSEEHLMFPPDYTTVDTRTLQCSPEVKPTAQNINRTIYCADISKSPYYMGTSYNFPTDTSSFHPGVHEVGGAADLTRLEFPFDKFHAITPNIFPRFHLADGTLDPYDPEEPSHDNLDAVVVKVEEIFPYSMDDDCLTSASTLAAHQQTNAEKCSPFSCSECGKCFITESYLACHQKVHSGVLPNPCLECGKSFESKSQLTRHLINHTGVRHYSCPECGKSFLHKSDLARHLRHHTGERPYVCPECGLYFMQKGHLTRHLKVHTGEKPFLCSECGKCFPRKDTYINHQQIHANRKPFACKECGKCFAVGGMLLLHQRTHAREEPTQPERGKPSKPTPKLQSVDLVEDFFPCSEGGVSALVGPQGGPSGRGLGTRVQVHPGEKPFLCLECGKSYSQKRHLLIHQRIHTGKLPFKCAECGKCFNEKRYLVNHQRNHIGVRPFSCSQCGKSFTWKESLIRHKKFHNGVRPHCCSECGKGFTQRGDLLRHQRTHVDKIFSC